MACRCQERREAIKRAVSSGSVKTVAKEARFVVRTMAEDAGRGLVRKGKAGRSFR